jgi:hypothetical protein
MKNAAIILLALLIGGCSGLREAVKGFKGVSTKVLEDNLKDSSKKDFNLDYETAYYKAEGVLGDIHCYVYAKDPQKKLIAVYVSETDTTPVGIFFKAIDKNRTQIQVSSPSSFAKESIAEKFFAALDKTLKEKKVNVQLDVTGEAAKIK